MRPGEQAAYDGDAAWYLYSFHLQLSPSFEGGFQFPETKGRSKLSTVDDGASNGNSIGCVVEATHEQSNPHANSLFVAKFKRFRHFFPGFNRKLIKLIDKGQLPGLISRINGCRALDLIVDFTLPVLVVGNNVQHGARNYPGVGTSNKKHTSQERADIILAISSIDQILQRIIATGSAPSHVSIYDGFHNLL